MCLTDLGTYVSLKTDEILKIDLGLLNLRVVFKLTWLKKKCTVYFLRFYHNELINGNFSSSSLLSHNPDKICPINFASGLKSCMTGCSPE